MLYLKIKVRFPSDKLIHQLIYISLSKQKTPVNSSPEFWEIRVKSQAAPKRKALHEKCLRKNLSVWGVADWLPKVDLVAKLLMNYNLFYTNKKPASSAVFPHLFRKLCFRGE